MEDNQSILPTSSNVVADIAVNTTIVEEGPRICPICNSVLKLYFINFNEKVMLCEDTRCKYPFYENNLVFFKEDDDLAFNDEVSSFKSRQTRDSHASGSVVSTAEWSDIDRINKAYESDDSFHQNTSARKANKHQMETRARTQENEERIKQNVEEIKQLNRLLYDSHDEVECIRNEKWIKNLFSMQSSSGMRLLKEQEIQKLKKNSLMCNRGEIKIDIDRQDSVSSIKIDYSNKSKRQKKNP